MLRAELRALRFACQLGLPLEEHGQLRQVLVPAEQLLGGDEISATIRSGLRAGMAVPRGRASEEPTWCPLRKREHG